MSSMVPRSANPHSPSVTQVASQGVQIQGIQTQHTSQPSSTSQEMIASGESVIPMVNRIPQFLQPSGPAAVNVSVLNNLSQARQVMSSTSLTGAGYMGFQGMGGTPMAMHTSNMMSSGMVSSGLPAQMVLSFGQSSNFTPMAGSGSLVGTAQISQNTALGSFASATSNISGNSDHGVSQPFANIQGTITMGQFVPGMNQNIMNELGASSISSGLGTMRVPYPGMSQQGLSGRQPLGVTNSSTTNMPLPQQTYEALQSQVSYKCLKVWEGFLAVKRPGQSGQFETEIITELQAYTGASVSETLATDWPPIMEIFRGGPQENVCKMLNYCIADFLVFRVLTESTFLEGMREMNHGITIKLPNCQRSQTLILCFLDKANLLGILFYGDSIPPQIVLETQQSELHHQQIHQQWTHQQWQRHQQRQQQQQQIHQQWQRLQQQQQRQQQQQQIHQQLQPQQHQQQQQQIHQQLQPQQHQQQQLQQHFQLQHPQPQHHRQQQPQQLQQQHFQPQHPQPQHHQPQQQQQLQQPQQQQQPHFQLQHPQPQPYQPQLEIDPQFLDQNYNAELDIAYLPDSWRS